MATADVAELDVRQGSLRLRIRRDARAAPLPRRRADSAGSNVREEPGIHRVAAPLTGVYYAASGPSSRPYVAVGDWVEQDTVVGLIETMKVFNEVTADCRGQVAAIPVQQGQLVHAGEPILLVDITAAPDQAGEVGP